MSGHPDPAAIDDDLTFGEWLDSLGDQDTEDEKPPLAEEPWQGTLDEI